MDPSLRTAGRLVECLLLAMGVLLAFGFLFSVIDSIPFLMNYWHLYSRPNTITAAWRDLEFALACGLGAFACFRSLARRLTEDADETQP